MTSATFSPPIVAGPTFQTTSGTFQLHFEPGPTSQMASATFSPPIVAGPAFQTTSGTFWPHIVAGITIPHHFLALKQPLAGSRRQGQRQGGARRPLGRRSPGERGEQAVNNGVCLTTVTAQAVKGRSQPLRRRASEPLRPNFSLVPPLQLADRTPAPAIQLFQRPLWIENPQ